MCVGECVCGCGEVGVSGKVGLGVERWCECGCREVAWVWGVRCGCDVEGCGRWVHGMEHVKIEGVEM